MMQVIRCSLTVAIEVPLLIVKGAHGSSFEPARYAMEVEGVIAHSPSLITFLFRVGDLVGLTVDTGLHDMVSADGTVIDVDIPGPECHSIPFFDFESFLYGFNH